LPALSLSNGFGKFGISQGYGAGFQSLMLRIKDGFNEFYLWRQILLQKNQKKKRANTTERSLELLTITSSFD